MKVLTTKEVCCLLQVTTKTLYLWVKNGIFPAPINYNVTDKKRGRQYMWNIKVIENWLSQ